MSEEEIPAEGGSAKDSAADEHFQRAGETLAAARLEKGMTLEQVSDRLKISIKYLQALEACHYDQLPGTAFTRGYLRSYARLMELDENDILDLFGETVQADEQVARLLQEKPLETHGPSGSKWLIIISIILILGFVGGSVYWWLGNSDQDDMPPAPVAETVAPDEEPEAAPTPELSNTADVIPAPEVDEAEIEEEELPVPVEPAVAIEPEAPAEIVVLELETPVEIVSATEEPAVQEDQLLVQFTGDCWVEVRDVNERILFSGIKTGASELSLTGAAPLKIKFGNVGAVAGVRFNGEPVKVNFSASGSKIGRLTLG
ncbi:DUF4115 domain-containing protein [Sansalvadorimonas sp. 2012CJ34-2]|uniref:DUF4115 domain-containing protein n=1 Tax=Parendozoicomonas callyspongiae TaxID=2942213 RepID=A0ABT0PE14_9GAMM|nr:RodZ domain-containing protein [Sansalvadorimonas sp. 2012CJ34-2]MCL6269017.1 DUF4115 domain-containing protein [Sansalvadorimonas sp. 2012CJ34-2]